MITPSQSCNYWILLLSACHECIRLDQTDVQHKYRGASPIAKSNSGLAISMTAFQCFGPWYSALAKAIAEPFFPIEIYFTHSFDGL